MPFNLEEIIDMAKSILKNPDDEFKKAYTYVTENMKVEIDDYS